MDMDLVYCAASLYSIPSQSSFTLCGKKKMKILNGTSYEPVNCCIYCGSTEKLSKEHILPFGLNGSSTLLKASCNKCANITGEIERRLLRGEFKSVRIYRELRSRRKHKNSKKEEKLNLTINGQKQSISLPINEFPILLYFHKFGIPGVLSGESLEGAIKIKGTVTILYGPNPKEVMKKYNATDIEVSTDTDPVSFARMIAKIAYSFAYAEGELNKIDDPSPLLSELLNENGVIGKYVGTLDKPLQSHDDVLHRLLVHTDNDKGLLIGEVQLFADSPTPCYGVILGKLKKTHNKSVEPTPLSCAV